MSHENGKVNENQEAIIELELNNGGKIECLIDTGFSGTLFLPRTFAEENNLEIGIREILHRHKNSLGIPTAHLHDQTENRVF